MTLELFGAQYGCGQQSGKAKKFSKLEAARLYEYWLMRKVVGSKTALEFLKSKAKNQKIYFGPVMVGMDAIKFLTEWGKVAK